MLSESVTAALLLAALAAAAWLLRRARPVSARRLAVVERQALGGGSFVATVRAGGRWFLVGTSAKETRLLAELDAADFAESSEAGELNGQDGAGEAVRSRFFAAKGGES